MQGTQSAAVNSTALRDEGRIPASVKIGSRRRASGSTLSEFEQALCAIGRASLVEYNNRFFSAVVLIVLAGITVSIQWARAALTEPAECLRSE